MRDGDDPAMEFLIKCGSTLPVVVVHDRCLQGVHEMYLKYLFSLEFNFLFTFSNMIDEKYHF